jgi:hypothetical protein
MLKTPHPQVRANGEAPRTHDGNAEQKKSRLEKAALSFYRAL